MALRGISSKASVPYVPEDDRSSPPEEQTVFWIKPKKFGDGNRTASRYMGCEKAITRKGFREVDPNRLKQADIEEFLDTVVKVENWIFSEDHPNGGVIIPVIEDPSDLKQVCMDMSNDLFNEIIDASNDMSRLRAGEKKSLKSSSISISGKQKKQIDKNPTTVTSVEKRGS